MAVNFGIIGYGTMARTCHRQLIGKTRGAKLLAVCDVTEACRKKAEEDGVERIYSSLSQLLKDDDVEVVVICTPSHNHVSLGTKVAAAGKHVMVEKPAARTAAELRKMIDAARKSGVLFTVFHNRRWDTDFLTARKIIDQKMIGDLVNVEARWIGYGSGVGFGTKDYNQKWRIQKQYGGGILMDLGVHLLDQVNQMIPGKPENLFGTMYGGVLEGSTVDEYASCMLRFDSGVTALMETSSISVSRLPRYRLLGTKGMAVVNDADKTFDVFIGSNDKPKKRLSLARPNPWQQLYKELAAAVQDRRRKLPVDPESVVTTMQLIDAVRKSARSGKSVKLTGPRAK